ncbi:hypothetical protein ASE75_06940 [Sphingomonas sp. Leaf17]|nr:hypothetical protein ASE75_06940 [Sphingomonas sp. Leaf17]
MVRHMILTTDTAIQRRLIDALYVEAMVLADEARSYFDESGRGDRDSLDPFVRVTFSCESLKITTRLMHVIAWLLTQRAVEAGELRPRDALDPSRRMGDAPATAGDVIGVLPERAQGLVAASMDLHRRVLRLDQAQALPEPVFSPARSMQMRLSSAF